MLLINQVLTTQDILVRYSKKPLVKHQKNIVEKIKKLNVFTTINSLFLLFWSETQYCLHICR